MGTRVHAISSFGIPQFNAFDFLASQTSLPQIYDFRQYPLEFTPDRDVSEEENYIYKRRDAVKEEKKDNDDSKENNDDSKKRGQRFGNVLDVPSLLLNKWTNEAEQEPQQQQHQQSQQEQEQEQERQDPLPTKTRAITRYGKATRRESDPSNLDILGFPARIAVNLEPDKAGVVSIPSDILEANHNLLTIIALDDNNTSVKYEKLKP